MIVRCIEGFEIIGEKRSTQSIPSNRKNWPKALFLDEPGNSLDLVIEMPVTVEVREPVLDENRLAYLEGVEASAFVLQLIQLDQQGPINQRELEVGNE